MNEPIEPSTPPAENRSQSAPQGAPAAVESRTLLAGREELIILHEGVSYRLRVTRQNKLILTK
jgi:hemin uptake protein HemP